MTHTPYREAGLDREAVARIIEPSAFTPETPLDNVVYQHCSKADGRHKALAKADAILALITSPTSEDAGEVERDEVCPLCEGRDLGPGGFCIAACREGKVRWTSANVLRNVKPWIEADQREIERLRAAIAGGAHDRAMVLEEAARVADDYLPDCENGRDAGIAALASVEIAAAIRQLASSPPEVGES